MPQNNTQKYFDSAAKNYGKNSQKFPWKNIRALELKSVEPFLRLSSAQKILELGCGDGFYTALLRKHQPKASLTCLDFSLPMLDRNPVQGIKKIHGNLEKYETNEKFDLIFCAGALEFLSNPFLVITKFQKNLNPAGKMILFFPRFSATGLLYLLFHHWHKNRVKLFRDRDAIKFQGNGTILVSKKVFPFNRLILVEAAP